MSEATILAKGILQKGQIDENTIADPNTQSDLDSLEYSQNKKFFGFGISSKEKNFFKLSDVSWNYTNTTAKGCNQKPKLAEALGWLWFFDFLTGGIPSNKTVIEKDTANSRNIAVFEQKNKIVTEYNRLYSYNKNIIDAVDVEIWDYANVVGNVVTFDQYHLLNVGDTIIIEGVEHTITDETTEGKVYTIDLAITDGVYELSYIYNFSDALTKYPKSSKNISYTVTGF